MTRIHTYFVTFEVNPTTSRQNLDTIYIYIYIYILSILLVDTTEKIFSSLSNKPSFRHKEQFGHYQGTKYTLINATNEL